MGRIAALTCGSHQPHLLHNLVGVGWSITPFSQSRTEDGFHIIHPSKDNSACQGSKGNLVEHRVLRHVVIYSDENREASKREANEQA